MAAHDEDEIAPVDTALEGHLKHDSTARIPNTTLRKISTHANDLDYMTEGARKAADAEKNMTLKDAFQTNKKGVVWAMLFTSAIIMEGFDLALLSGFYAFPAFQKAYGIRLGIDKDGDGEEDWGIPPEWQTALSAGAQIGQIIGLCIAGIVAQRVGYNRTMIGALTLMTIFVFIPVFSGSKEVLLVGEIMQGIPWGVFETMPAAYASEIAPLALRPYITTWANMCWVLGQLIAAGVLRGCLTMGEDNTWAFRLPFMLQWLWPVPILVAILFAPESPWWLERRGHTEKARLSLQKVSSCNPEQIQNTLELIKHTVLMEKNRKESENNVRKSSAWNRMTDMLSSYVQCFKGVDRRRTEITCGTWVSQSLCGSNMMLAFAPVFFRAAGLKPEEAFSLQVGALALGVIGTLLAWILMSHAGRRTIYVWGLFFLFATLLVIGCLGLAPSKPGSGVAWVSAGLLVVYIVIYDLSVGPTCYAIVTEMPSTGLRAATVALARICYNLCGIFSVVMNPLMLNKSGWGWGTKAALFWAGLCFLCWQWAFWRLPEPKGRNFGELDVLFHDEISARNFKHSHVDQFSSNTHDVKAVGSNDVEGARGRPDSESSTHTGSGRPCPSTYR